MPGSLPTQTQMLLPLLEAIHDAGGVATPGALYDEVATRLGITDEVRNATITGKQKEEYNLFERRVRWTKQTAVARGLIETERRGVWALTDAANAKLRNVVRGAILTIFETDRGVFLWANAEDAVGIIERESVDLLLSSPPYALISSKEYGNLDETAWVDWMLKICEGSRELLRPTGSMILNLGNCWVPGKPQQSLYIQRLLVRLEDELDIHLCQELFWHSPTKLPVPLAWVGVRRVRLTSSVEPLLWLSPNPDLVNSDNRRVLRAYTASGLRSINNERDRDGNRPNGVQFGRNSFVDRGGSIPPSLITATPISVEERRYREAIAAAGRKPHPAIMPAAVARFCIELATEKDHTVLDLFSGSGTVPIEAMKLGRYAIAVDRSLEYIENSEIRCHAEGITTRRLALAA
jgi:DNA modification methylase